MTIAFPGWLRRGVVVVVVLITTTCFAENGPTRIAQSTGGMVASAQPIAAAVGARMLECGGNAVDAAVATAFSLAVVEPSMSGLGGRTQILIRTAQGEFVGIDGATQVPAKYTPGATTSGTGYLTVAVPGTVAALDEALRNFGTMRLADVMAPALELAENGFPLGSREASKIAGAAEIVRKHEETRRVFLKPDGSTYRGGDVFRQPDLARTLRTICECGMAAFYCGPISERISQDMTTQGGFVTSDDLANYKPQRMLIARGSYRGHELVGTYWPASGATIIEILHVMEQFEPAELAEQWQWMRVAAGAIRIGFEDRGKALGTNEEKLRTLTSKDWARTRAHDLRALWATAAKENAACDDEVLVGESPYTTHLSVVDRQGVAVSLTQSLGPAMGSKVVSPGLGFLYASTMGYLGPNLAPRSRAGSSIAPMMVLKDGHLHWVLGAAGGDRIISSLALTLSRGIDQRLSLAEATDAPRLHPTAARRIEFEGRPGEIWPLTDIEKLTDSGLELKQGSQFGRVYAVGINPSRNLFIGVADRREEGAAHGPGRLSQLDR